MKLKIIRYSIILFGFALSCKSNEESIIKKIEILDHQKTTELIKYILEEEKYRDLSSSCILEQSPPLEFHGGMKEDFDSYLKDLLQIKNSIHYKTQRKLLRNFKVNKSLVPQKRILQKQLFNKFEEKSKIERFRFWDWLDENCEQGYCFLSKPIFNETFDLAYVQMGSVCGGLCGGGEIKIYEFKNGIWSVKESLGTWVH